MTAVSVSMTGALLDHNRQGLDPRASGAGSLRQPHAQETRPDLGRRDPGPGDADAKWPAWKVTSFVILFCGAFWTAVVYLISALF
jgi:hypothetical protein